MKFIDQTEYGYRIGLNLYAQAIKSPIDNKMYVAVSDYESGQGHWYTVDTIGLANALGEMDPNRSDYYAAKAAWQQIAIDILAAAKYKPATN